MVGRLSRASGCDRLQYERYPTGIWSYSKKHTGGEKIGSYRNCLFPTSGCWRIFERRGYTFLNILGMEDSKGSKGERVVKGYGVWYIRWRLDGVGKSLIAGKLLLSDVTSLGSYGYSIISIALSTVNCFHHCSPAFYMALHQTNQAVYHKSQCHIFFARTALCSFQPSSIEFSTPKRTSCG